jgi:hypothetical protein
MPAHTARATPSGTSRSGAAFPLEDPVVCQWLSGICSGRSSHCGAIDPDEGAVAQTIDENRSVIAETIHEDRTAIAEAVDPTLI